MDSMRTLNTSLPSSASAQPPEQLLQAFKTAALSVTNLYKTAHSDQANSRHLGYQEALEDLRAFLDREKLALDDAEGQKIRKWVVSRIDGTGTTTTTTTTTTSDSEDERAGDRKEDNKRTGSSSPARKESPDTTRRNSQPATSTMNNSSPNEPPPSLPQAPTFTFAAGPQWPSALPEDADMRSSNSVSSTSSDSITSPSIRLEVIPRGPRTPHRNNARHRNQSSTRDPSANTGSKRKFGFGDFFDVSDGFGGGKRGRFL